MRIRELLKLLSKLKLRLMVKCLKSYNEVKPALGGRKRSGEDYEIKIIIWFMQRRFLCNRLDSRMAFLVCLPQN